MSNSMENQVNFLSFQETNQYRFAGQERDYQITFALISCGYKFTEFP